jgi:sn-glycerol 3-phosphate transport system substrate-binding protein
METAPGRALVDVWLLYYHTPSYLDGMKELAEKFNDAHPRYHVNIQGHYYRTLPEELFRAAQDGHRPAVAQFFYATAQLARDMRGKDGKPLFASVGKAVGGRTEILGEPVVLGDLLPAVRDYYTCDGHVAAVPLVASTALLYANTTVLERAGISEAPRTWKEVEAACAAVAELPDGPAHAITWPNHGWFFQQSLAQQGGLLADRDNGRSGRAETVDLATGEMLAYVRWWQRLQRDGHYLYTGVGAWEANFAAFAEQRVAMTMSSSVEAVRMIQAGRDGGFGVLPCRMPHNDGVPYAGNMIGGDALWLADGLDEVTRDGALAFLQFVVNPRNAADRHKTSHFIPPTRASADLLAAEGWFAQDPGLRVALEQLDAADGSPAARGALLGGFADIQDMMTRAMDEVLVSGADPAARFAQASAEAQRLLDDYNAHCLGKGPGPRGPNRFTVG